MKKELFICLVVILSFLFVQHLIAVHNPGKDCFVCHGHSKYTIGGTVFTDSSGKTIKANLSCALTRPDGSRKWLTTNDAGNIVSTDTIEGTFLITIGNRISRTWHTLPQQKSCNTCHNKDTVNAYPNKRTFPVNHTTIPSDNKCTNCHHFPASVSLNNLKPSSVLDGSHKTEWFYESFLMIEKNVYWLTTVNYQITTSRPDIFAEGFYSLFDIILDVAEEREIPIEYYYDDSCKTHFITKINNIEGNYWYSLSYSWEPSKVSTEISYRRANRWDETLWQNGTFIRIFNDDNLEEIKKEFREEIRRENDSGHIIPLVRFSINPSDFKGNPPGSGRITVNKEFHNVLVTPHNLRATGYPSIYSKPFKPGVVTSMDILLSLKDQGGLNFVTGVFFDSLDAYSIVELGFPDEGIAHASGWQGFEYLTENGTFDDLPNNADTNQYMPCDINVVHAQDFSYWKWFERGNPYFEISDPTLDVSEEQIKDDYLSLERGFNLHNPYPNPFNNSLRIRFNVFEPDNFNLSLYNLSGEKIATIFNGIINDIGVQELNWNTKKLTNGIYFLILKNSKTIQEKSVVYLKE